MTENSLMYQTQIQISNESDEVNFGPQFQNEDWHFLELF